MDGATPQCYHSNLWCSRVARELKPRGRIWSPGQPGDVPAIITLSRRIAAYYRQIIEWTRSVRDADVDPLWRPYAYEVSLISDPALQTIEAFGPNILEQLQEAAEQPPESRVSIHAELVLEAPDMTRVQRAMAELEEKILGKEYPAAPEEPGYLYVLTNPSLGSLIKIGKTTRSPRDRLSELSAASGVPTPFVLAFDAFVENCSEAETYVHSRLEDDGYRVADNREFFDVDLTTAIGLVLEAQKAVSSP